VVYALSVGRKTKAFVLQILIVEPEYLIALEAERILQLFGGSEMTIAMPRDYLAILKDRSFDVVLIASKLVTTPEAEAALRGSAAGIVFSTLRREELDGIAGWPGVPVVSKPFDDEELLNAIKNAARGRTAFSSKM
jgi:DNA-binding response OmpR family regulator